MKFSELQLNANVLEALDAMRFDECTPIQEQAIPIILEGKDLIAVAQTGTDQKIGQRLVQRKAADGGLGEEGYHKNTSGQFCFATILYSSPGSKKGQAAVLQER